MRDTVNAEMVVVAEGIGAQRKIHASIRRQRKMSIGVSAGSGFDDAVDALAGDDTGFTFTIDNDEGPTGNTADTQASSAGLQTSPL